MRRDLDVHGRTRAVSEGETSRRDKRASLLRPFVAPVRLPLAAGLGRHAGFASVPGDHENRDVERASLRLVCWRSGVRPVTQGSVAIEGGPEGNTLGSVWRRARWHAGEASVPAEAGCDGDANRGEQMGVGSRPACRAGSYPRRLTARGRPRVIRRIGVRRVTPELSCSAAPRELQVLTHGFASSWWALDRRVRGRGQAAP